MPISTIPFFDHSVQLCNFGLFISYMKAWKDQFYIKNLEQRSSFDEINSRNNDYNFLSRDNTLICKMEERWGKMEELYIFLPL